MFFPFVLVLSQTPFVLSFIKLLPNTFHLLTSKAILSFNSLSLRYSWASGAHYVLQISNYCIDTIAFVHHVSLFYDFEGGTAVCVNP